MTVTVNPLMGNLSSTYSVLASPLFALSSRFDFNVYSYESELQLGTELWRRKPKPPPAEDLNWARAKLGKDLIPLLETADPLNAAAAASPYNGEDLAGCFKARVDQRGGLALLWEGRMKELLYTCGMTVDLKGGENIFRGIGLEVQYSS